MYFTLEFGVEKNCDKQTLSFCTGCRMGSFFLGSHLKEFQRSMDPLDWTSGRDDLDE